MNVTDALRRHSARLSAQVTTQVTTQLTTAVVIAAVFVTGFAFGNHYSVGAAQSPFTEPESAEEAFMPFWQVYNMIQNNYVDPEGDPLDQVALVDGAIRGMVDSLGDQFSGYMDATEFPMINEELEGEIQGIGVVIRTNDETREIEIVSVMADTPAAEAGLLPGDVFAAVDGQDVAGMNQMQLSQLVRGPEGTPVDITMRRGNALVDFTITRERIVVPMVESRLLDDNIGYVKLNQFGPQARTEVDRALDTLGGRDLNGLVFDMRGNPGGLLTSAIDVGSAFIASGPIVVEDFGNHAETYNATGNYAGLDMPMVILVDESSASAAELVAGAIQDHGVATVIGEVTFGKGTVQTWQNLVNGGGVRLTVARWLTPNGHWIHGEGVTPDIVVEWNPADPTDTTDLQLAAAVDYLAAEITAQADIVTQ